MVKANKELRQLRYNNGTASRMDHCAFPKLNSNGRCIAACHRIHDGIDCIGNGDKTDSHKNEVRVTFGFLDGRNVEVDDKGYPIPKGVKTAVESDGLPSYKGYGWGTYIEDSTGKIFQFAYNEDGSKYRRYQKK